MAVIFKKVEEEFYLLFGPVGRGAEAVGPAQFTLEGGDDGFWVLTG